MGYFKNGNSIMLWGGLGRDATYREFPKSGKRVANFSINYLTEKVRGKYINKYMNIDAWGDIALYAGNLEAGDTVLVCGSVELDEYESKKKGEDVYKVVCRRNDVILLQARAGAVVGGETLPTPGFTASYEEEDDNPFD